MGRLVEARRASDSELTTAQGASSEEVTQQALTRIAKYIPAEVLAFYAIWTQGSAQIAHLVPTLPLCLLGAVIGVVVTWFYFDRFFPEARPEERAAHRILSPIAFLVHGYVIAGAVIPEIFESGIALMATALMTLVSAVYQPVVKD